MSNQPFAFNHLVASPLLAIALLAASSAAAQTVVQTAPQPKPESTTDTQVLLAITWTAASANSTQLNRFWLQGGSAEFTVPFKHGLGFTMNLTGLHSGNSGTVNIPVNLVTYTVGPSYHVKATSGAHPVTLFGNGLLGLTVGFKGLYPAPYATTSSAKSFALNLGGGADLALTPHIALRLFEASWFRTQLPNAANSAQNNLNLSTGIVIHNR
jgi:opacity protein-like surface antigen